MMKVENTITIQASVEKVFGFAHDPEKYTVWQSGVESVTFEDETMKPGSQFTEVRKFMMREMKTTLEITRHEPNKLFAAKTLSGPVPYEFTETFEPVDEGTKITVSIEGDPGGFFKLAEGAVKKQLEKSLQKDYQKLKEIIESA